MSNDQYLDDGMERLEIGQSQVQVPRDFNITPNVELKLRKQFNNPEFIERTPGRGHSRTPTNEDRYLSITASDNKSATASGSLVMRPQAK